MGSRAGLLIAAGMLLAAQCLADPRFGSLKISSEPDSAQVYLDGALRGMTPADISAVLPGKHLLVVRKPGYKKYSKVLTFEGGKRVVGNAKLEAMTQAEADSVRSADSARTAAEAVGTTPDKGAYVAVDKAPELIYRTEPIYPEAAMQYGITGKVFVQILIDIDGTVIKAEVAKSSRNELLDAAAVEAALQWKFTPAIASGNKPVRVWVMQSFTFKLNE